MIVCNLIGGLGNQMFQYACARALSLDLNFPLKFCTDSFYLYNAHNGFELANVFGLNIEIASDADLVRLIGKGRSLPILRRILAKKNFSWYAGRRFLREPDFGHFSNLFEQARNGGYLHGYWQSELYFSKHTESIRSDFAFKDELQGANFELANSIAQSCSVSLHVRRGDYVSNSKTLSIHGTCTPEYYFKAIDSMLKRFPDARFFAFSDDLLWVSQVLTPRYPSLVLVKHNEGPMSYNDMRLMSLCRHHIIANSSFSWWGAWLNSRPDKVVIAPAKWFADGRDIKYLIPVSWECL
jgi:hypothetical protein